MSLKGILAGPVVGLKYQTPRHCGVTNERGEFDYEPGERVAFLIGSQAMGSALGAPRLTLADIVSRVDGNPHKLMDPGLTNIARFLCTLDHVGNLDTGILIPPRVHDIIGRRRIDFRHDVDFAGGPTDKIAAFADDPNVMGILADLNRAGIFAEGESRTLCSAATARNEVRRHIMGIRRFRDVRIPLRNGLFVLADVFRPDKEGRFPVIMNCGPYGRAFHHHSICSQADFLAHEEMEERYFLGNPEGLVFENHETVNTAVWVPADYVVIRVDGPGTGKNPGKLAPWGIETAEAFRDAIEWAADQPWTNGHVGLWGMSYYAMSQHAAASLKPRGLKAMVAIGTDIDMYEEVAYTGGILNAEFFSHWYRNGVLPPVCGTPDEVGFTELVRRAPFKDSDPAAAFGPRSTVFMNADISAVQVPLWWWPAPRTLRIFISWAAARPISQLPRRTRRSISWRTGLPSRTRAGRWPITWRSLTTGSRACRTGSWGGRRCAWRSVRAMAAPSCRKNRSGRSRGPIPALAFRRGPGRVARG